MTETEKATATLKNTGLMSVYGYMRLEGTVPPLLSRSLGTLDPSPDDQGSG